MSKKPIQIKEIEGPQFHEISKPQWSDEETAKIITDLADLYEIPYENSTNRIITKFLWLPKSINGQWKWLVTASWQEQFVEVIDYEALHSRSFNCLTWVWKPVKWVEK